MGPVAKWTRPSILGETFFMSSKKIDGVPFYHPDPHPFPFHTYFAILRVIQLLNRFAVSEWHSRSWDRSIWLHCVHDDTHSAPLACIPQADNRFSLVFFSGSPSLHPSTPLQCYNISRTRASHAIILSASLSPRCFHQPNFRRDLYNGERNGQYFGQFSSFVHTHERISRQAKNNWNS